MTPNDHTYFALWFLSHILFPCVGGGLYFRISRFVELSCDAVPAQFEFGDDALGQHLSQFDPPLVERINLPDNALGENAVFISATSFPSADGVSRSSRIVLDGRLPSKVRCGTSQAVCLRPGLPRCFAKRQRLRLGKNVGQEEIVVAAEWV